MCVPSMYVPGLFSLMYWEQGSIKFVKVLEPSNCSSSSTQVQFQKWRILLVHVVILVQNMLELSEMYLL